MARKRFEYEELLGIKKLFNYSWKAVKYLVEWIREEYPEVYEVIEKKNYHNADEIVLDQELAEILMLGLLDIYKKEIIEVKYEECEEEEDLDRCYNKTAYLIELTSDISFSKYLVIKIPNVTFALKYRI